jgi:hypothetical protein
MNNRITEKTNPEILFKNNIDEISINNILASLLKGSKNNDIKKNQIQILMNNIMLIY